MGRVSETLKGVNSPAAIEDAIANSTSVHDIQLELIDRWEQQPRKFFDQGALESLADTFKRKGFKGVILVRPHPEREKRYQIVWGERRFRAAQIAALPSVQCCVEQLDDDEALDLAMGENLLREDLSKLEETIGLLAVLQSKTGLEESAIIRMVNSHTRYWKNGSYTGTNDEAAEKLPVIVELLKRYNVALSTFKSKHLQVLGLPEDVKKAHLEGGLDYSKAIEIGKIGDEFERADMLELVAEGKLTSLKDVSEAVKDLTEEPKRAPTQEDWQGRFKFAVTKFKSQKTWEYLMQDAERKDRIQSLVQELEELLEDE